MACLGATGSTCTGLTSDEGCVPPKVYNAGLPELEHTHLSFDGTKFIADWLPTPSYPTHIIRGFIRAINVPSFTQDGISYVSRDTDHIDLTNGGDIVLGKFYRINIRLESDTEFGRTITLEVKAEVFNEFPIGLDLLVHGSEDVLIGAEYIYV